MGRPAVAIDAGPTHAEEPDRPGRSAWTLIVIGAGLLVIGLLRVTFEVLGGLVTGHLTYALGRATVSAIFLILPGLLLAKRGLTGRWLR